MKYLDKMVKVRVRGSEMHYVNECPHKDRSTECVDPCMCVCVHCLM